MNQSKSETEINRLSKELDIPTDRLVMLLKTHVVVKTLIVQESNLLNGMKI